MLMLELLIALAVFALATSAVALLFGMDAHAAADLASERQAREAVEETLERAQAGGDTAETTPVSPCLMRAAVGEAYPLSGGRSGTTSATTLIIDADELVKLGMDCQVFPAGGATKALVANELAGIGTTTTLDVLGDTAYVGLAEPPYLAVVEDAAGTASVHASFADGFALSAPPNALDAIETLDEGGTRRRYVYAALDATSSQLAVIDVTDPTAPVSTESATLRNVDPDGEEPAGWRILYYGDSLYVTTRYTAGRELHIFDAADPAAPVELGGGTELGITVNDLAVLDQEESRYLFAAAARDGGEAAVYDVTDPSRSGAATEIAAARTDLPGGQDSLSLALLGDRLYLGRAANAGGGELVILDASMPAHGLPIAGSAPVGSSVTDIRAWDGKLVIRTAKDGGDVELWDARDAAAPLRVGAVQAEGSGIDLEETSSFAISGNALIRFLLSP
jgi:type II secretory pathway pseudopilin PulG